MKISKRVKSFVTDLTGTNEISRLASENSILRNQERTAIDYIRKKVNQLLMVMGTLPLRPEELDDQTLLDLDPIGIVAESFAQVLDHLNDTNEKLQAAHDEIQAILSAAGVAILVVDDAMRIKAYNPRFRELVRRSESDIRGQTCHAILCGSDRPPETCTFMKVMSSRRPIRQNGWSYGDSVYDVAGAPLKNKYGDIAHVVLVYNDITDRSRSEAALRESERMYRTLFDNVPDLIQSVRPDGSFLYVNPAWMQALGYCQEEVSTLTIHDIIHSDHQAQCSAVLQQVISGDFTGRISTVFVARNGREIKVDGNVSCCFQGGKPLFTCGIFRQEP